MSLQSTHHQGFSQVCELDLSELGNFFPGWNRSWRELFLVGGSLGPGLSAGCWHGRCQGWEEGLSSPDPPCVKNIPGAQVPTPLWDLTFLRAFRVVDVVTPDTAAFLEVHNIFRPCFIFRTYFKSSCAIFLSSSSSRRDTEITTCHWDVPG